MRIVHVVRQFRPGIGGLENVVWELASKQILAGHDVRVVTLNRLFDAARGVRLPQRENMDGIEVVRIPFFGSRRYPIAISALRHVKDANLVHVHGIDFFFDFLALTVPLHRRTLVASTHGAFFHTPFAAPLKRIYFATATRLALTRYAAVAAVSRSDYHLFSRVRSHGLALIENGVNTDKFADAGARRPVKAMLAIGRFSSNKRLERVIECLAALRQRDPDWVLTIAGRPWDLDAGDLRAYAEAAGAGDAVEVLASPSDEAIRAAMAKSSVIVSASDYEGFGLAAVEGMSAGLFPLLSDIPPFRELVERNGIGLVADFSQPETVAAQFVRTWRETARDYEHCRATAITAAARYGWPRVAEDYERLCNSALGNGVRAILDIGVQAMDVSAAFALLDDRFARDEPTHVAFANAHTLNTASADPAVRDALRRSIVFNDGLGVDIASRLLFGRPFPDNLNGTDFVPKYLRQTRHRYRIFLLGAAPGVADAAARHIAQLASRHQVVGSCHGYTHPQDTPQLIADIRATRADLLLVGMGNPAQELWLMEHLAETGCRLGLGVGALFDFMAGRLTRAPAWMRMLRMEWVHRLLHEPHRLWRRYLLGNPAFLLRVAGQWLGGARVPERADANM